MYRRITSITVVAALAVALTAQAMGAGARSGDVGIVSNIKVLSDKVEDVSSVEAWKKSFIKPGMTDREKGLAVWRSISMFRVQETPPKDFLRSIEKCVHDPIKTFNVFGYGMCCCASSNVECLSRAAGLKARGRGITAHSVPEAFWDGKWHMLDTSMVTYFPFDDGHIASVEELIKVRAAYQKDHPDFKPSWGKPLKKEWPEPYRNSAGADHRGILPARTHGLYSEWHCYNGKNNFVYEYGYSQGYRLNIRLREGEKLVRNWSHKGLHVNMDGLGGKPGCLGMKVGQKFLVYTPKFGDLANGRIGNGERIYDVPLMTGRYRQGAMAAQNLRDTKSGVIAADGGKPGVLEIRMPSSYIYLGGELKGHARVGQGGSIKIKMSRNNGLDWKEIGSVTEPGDFEIDLKDATYRLFDYRLKLELSGAGTGLSALGIRHDIQHSQRALPALGQGTNTISFDATAARESTVTIEAPTLTTNQGNQLNYLEYHPKVVNLEAKQLKLSSGEGSVTFPVETPGDMTRLRFGCHYGSWGKDDGWAYQCSFDKGRSWKTVCRVVRPDWGGWGACHYVTVDDVPEGTRKALVRFAGRARSGLIMCGFRIDADYIEPRGGFAPVKITYTWEENGAPKRAVHVARKAKDSFKINCAAKPVMKSIVLELAR